MKIYDLTKNYSVVCEWKDKRSGFTHIATLCLNGVEQRKTKCHYENRTWERFEYETAIKKVIDLEFKNDENEYFRNIVKSLV